MAFSKIYIHLRLKFKISFIYRYNVYFVSVLVVICLEVESFFGKLRNNLKSKLTLVDFTSRHNQVGFKLEEG